MSLVTLSLIRTPEHQTFTSVRLFHIQAQWVTLAAEDFCVGEIRDVDRSFPLREKCASGNM